MFISVKTQHECPLNWHLSQIYVTCVNATLKQKNCSNQYHDRFQFNSWFLFNEFSNTMDILSNTIHLLFYSLSVWNVTYIKKYVAGQCFFNFSIAFYIWSCLGFGTTIFFSIRFNSMKPVNEKWILQTYFELII